MSQQTAETESAPAASRREARRANLLSILVWSIARLVGLTLRVRWVNKEGLEPAADGRGAILVTWHGRTLVPANVFHGRGYWALISMSRDGEIQDRIFRRFGYQTIRGSTGRGGVRAVLQLARKIREGGVLAFTPDGPRGPTHQVQQGTVFLAQRSGCPVIPLGISARPRLLLGTWDRYMIPAPFSRVSFVVGEAQYVDPDLDEAGRERAAEALARAINACEKHAEEALGFSYPSEFAC